MPKVANPVSFNCPLSVPSLCSGLLLMVQMGSKMGSIASDNIWKLSIRCIRKRTRSAYRLGNLADNTIKRYAITLLWSQKAHTHTVYPVTPNAGMFYQRGYKQE